MLRHLIKTGRVSQILQELNAEVLASPRAQESEAQENNPERAQMRQCAKIWTTLGKLIRSQCNKGRIVDSLYFGSFGTESAARGMPSDPNGHYIYCPGPRSIFDLVENSDNMSQIDPNVSVSKYLTSL